MPKEPFPGTVPPLLLLVIAAAVFGVVAQVGVTLALGIARSRKQFIGFALLSLVFSGASTVLLAELAHMKPTIAATIGALVGTVPSLMVLRIALKNLPGRVGVEIEPGDLKELEAKEK